MDILEVGEGADEIWLLHGSPGSPERLQELAEALSDEHTVCVPDIYGFGGGEVPEVFRVEAIRKELDEAMHEEAAGSIVGIGHSSGAYRLLDLALHTNVEFSKLVLLAPNPGVSDEAREGIAHLTSLVQSDTDIAPILVDAWLSDRFKRDEQPAVQDMIEWFRGLDPKLFLRMLEERKITPVITEQLEDVDVSCLVIAGDQEQDMANAIADALSAERLIIEETGHFPHIEAPEKTRDAILEFLE